MTCIFSADSSRMAQDPNPKQEELEVAVESVDDVDSRSGNGGALVTVLESTPDPNHDDYPRKQST